MSQKMGSKPTSLIRNENIQFTETPCRRATSFWAPQSLMCKRCRLHIGDFTLHQEIAEECMLFQKVRCIELHASPIHWQTRKSATSCRFFWSCSFSLMDGSFLAGPRWSGDLAICGPRPLSRAFVRRCISSITCLLASVLRLAGHHRG